MKLYLIVFISFFSVNVFGQINSNYIAFNKLDIENFEFLHGYGLKITGYFTNSQPNISKAQFGINGGGLGLLYNARYNFALTDDIGLSINSYPGVGFMFIDRASFGFDFPMMAQINIGRYASYQSNSNVGAQFGFGYGVGGTTAPFFYHGIAAIGGVTFGFGPERSISLNIKYQNVNKYGHLIDFTFIYNFSG